MTERSFDALVARLAEYGQIEVEGPLVRLARFTPTLSVAQRAQRDAIHARIAEAGLAGLSHAALAAAEPEAISLARLLERDRAIVTVPGVGWVDAEALGALREQLRAHFEGHDILQPADLKAMTGLSRKTAIPLLEWLDTQRWTVRRRDARARGDAL